MRRQNSPYSTDTGTSPQKRRIVSTATSPPVAAASSMSELFSLTDAPGVLLERDDDFPPEAKLLAELRAIADAARWGSEHRVRA